jgi:hypothetical protein
METNDYLESRFTKDPSIVFRKVADEFILVPIKQKASDVESIYTMNDVASRIWELINGKRSLKDIKTIIIKEFEVSPEEAEKDLVDFSKQLEKIGALRVV